MTAGRALRRLFGGSGVQRQSAGSEHDRFAPFRSLDGPVLAGGPTVRHDPDLDARPSLVVLLPHLTLARMSGGPNTIFQVTAAYRDPTNNFDPGGRLGQLSVRLNW